MRNIDAIRWSAPVALAIAAAFTLTTVRAEEHFDACEVFTQADAEQALETAAAAEPVNPKAHRPKVVNACSYNGFKDGKAVAASAQFRFGRNESEAQQAFEDARLRFQTKPLLISGAEAFWSAKTGQMNLRKGRTWVTLSVGPAKPDERDLDQAKKLAQIIATKI